MLTPRPHDIPTLDEGIAMNEPMTPGVPRVHVVKPALPDPAARPEPLRYAYTHTRVAPDVRSRMLRLPAIVKGDGSPLSQMFRMLRSQVLQRLRAQGHRVLGVTSPRRVHGKSPTALNLALTLAADLDTSVLLVDAELDGQGVQRLLGLNAEPGLVEHLVQGTPLPALLLNPEVERLVLLPAGALAVPNPSELLAMRATQHLVQELRQRYADRVVVVDLPPLLDSADAIAFLPWVDTTLLVVEEQGSRMRDLEAAAELLAPYNLVGTVMSQPPARGRRSRSWLDGAA